MQIHWDLPKKERKKPSTPPAPQNNCNTLINNVLQFNKTLLRQQKTVVAPKIVQKVKTYPNRKAVLKDCGGDVSKRWYIEFYIWNIDYQRLDRVREYAGFSKWKTAEGKRIYAKDRIRKINAKLRYVAVMEMPYPNYIQEQEKKEVFNKTYTLKTAISHIISISYPKSKNKKTLQTYTSICAKFETWCAEAGVPLHDINLIKKIHVQKYVDHLQTFENLHANTIVSNHSKLKAVFNKMVTREMIEKNPFIKIELPKEILTTRNIAFTSSEQQEIKKAVQVSRPELWRIIQILYYCFIRSTEMRRLKVENVMLENRKIYLSGTISKNGKEEFVSIPDPLIREFEKMNLAQFPKDYYLVGSGGVPSVKPMAANWIGNNHKKVLDGLNITGKTFYSWKHTGVVEAYKSGVDIKAIQLQCRHASIEQTDQYLKSLGFRDNEAFIMGVKEL